MVCIDVSQRENAVNAELSAATGLADKIIIPGERWVNHLLAIRQQRYTIPLVVNRNLSSIPPHICVVGDHWINTGVYSQTVVSGVYFNNMITHGINNIVVDH